VWYQYSESRRGENPKRHLNGFTGVLQADAYAGHDRLFADGLIVEAACWAHCRRKFYEIHERQEHVSGTVAHQALQRIGALYAIEQAVRGHGAEQRRLCCQTHARPLQLQLGLNEMLLRLSAKSPMAAAIGYALSNWRSLRGVVLGRKNYLHLGSDSGDECAAITYSLVGTCKLNGVHPYAYLQHVLERIVDHPINRVAEFLPRMVACQLGTPTQNLQLAA
jgi:transposase